MKQGFLFLVLFFLNSHAFAWNAPSISSPSANADVWVGVALNWNAVSNSQKYEVQLDTTPGFNSSVLLSATNTYINSSSSNSDTQASFSGIYFGTTYYWRVRAYITGDTSAWTNSSFNTRDYVNVSSPSDGTSSWTGLTLNWAPHSGVSFYDVQVDTSINFNSPAFRTVTNSYINSTDGNNDTQWFINNLFFGETYYWRVRARNSVDSSAWSSPLSFLTRDYVNSSGPADASSVWTGLTLNWAPHTGVSFYDVQVDTSTNFNSPAFRTVTNSYINSTDGNNDTQWFIDDLYFGKTYYWRVRARNSVDSSGWTEPLTFITRDYVNKTSPSNTDTWTGLTINWAPHNGVDFYDMQVDTTPTFTSSELNTYSTSYINSTDGNSDTQYFVQDLLFGIRYYWRVRARNAVDTSSWNDSFVFDTRNYVTLTSPADGNQNTNLNPTLNWSPHSGIVKYHQQLDTSNLFNTSAFTENFKNYINSTDGNSDTQQGYSGLLPNTIYFWRVRAINNRDTSAWTVRWFNTGNGTPVFPETPSISSTFCSGQATDPTPLLTWNPVVNAEFYEIEIKPSTIPLSGNPNASQIQSTTFQTSVLNSGSAYCWAVRAVSGNIAGPWSSPCCFVVPGSPQISQAFVSQDTYCEADELTFTVDISGTFLPENEFIIQLSDAFGNFTNPLDILSTQIAQSQYTATLPLSYSGSGFKVRIVSTAPIIQGEESESFTINELPELTGELSTVTCVQLASIELPVIQPEGGVYAGEFVQGNLFSPADAGVGSFDITYSYTNSNGCTASSSGLIVVDACTYLSDEIMVRQYNNSLSVEVLSASKVVFQLYDLSGRLLLVSQFNKMQNKIDLQNFPNGIYVYTISGLHSKSNGLIPINQN